MKNPKKEKDKQEEGWREKCEQLEKELELTQKERDEYLKGWKRAKADLVNFKKETAEAITELAELAKANLVRAILPVIDALEEAEKNNIEGLNNIRDLFMNIAKDEGLEKIIPKKGKDFDPEVHEAIDGEGTVVERVIQAGYRYKGRIVRPAKVSVCEK